MARHITKLNPKALVETASFLSEKGRIAGIYPIDTFAEFDALAASSGLLPNRICSVRPTPEKPAHRILFEYAFQESESFRIEELIIEQEGRHNYSDNYRELTRDFYLNF